jgi:RNA polymerase sigma-70 factor, ECF subfamily
MGGEEVSDKLLVQQTLAGDSHALAILHKRYYARLYRLALFRTRSVADAEDIAAETFLKAIDHFPSFRFQGESLFPWLSRIATNLTIDQQRRQKTTPLLSYDQRTADDVRTLLDALEIDGPDPHALAERGETQALLKSAIEKLPADQADAVLLRFGGDLSLQEISATMGRSEGAIKSLLHRGLVNLRKSLCDHAEEIGVLETLRHQSVSQEVATTKQRHGYIEL